MENGSNILDNDISLFDSYSNEINAKLEEAYKALGTQESIDNYMQDVELSNTKNDNYKKFCDIDILKIELLPDAFDKEKSHILDLYNSINFDNILTSDAIEAAKISKTLDNIESLLNQLDISIDDILKIKTKTNDENQNQIKQIIEQSQEVPEKVIDKYRNLVLYSAWIEKDSYKDIVRQFEREKYIQELKKLLNKQEENDISELQERINKVISDYDEKLQYLEDLSSENNEYNEELSELRSFYDKTIAYDDMDYNSSKKAYDTLQNENVISKEISILEEKIIDNIESKKNEEHLIENNNLKNSIDYILNNYANELTLEEHQLLDDICNNDYNITDYKEFKSIINKLWNNSITNIYSFNTDENYCFICTNNQFIDEKYETILLTKKIVDSMTDYNDYQIGFICKYYDNILYTTEKNDIMEATQNDKNIFKTPIQIEQEYLDHNIQNKIALNGYITKIEAVYFIDDGNKDKYFKALELANANNIPLIRIKK